MLASDATTQVAYVGDMSVDELALDFDDAFGGGRKALDVSENAAAAVKSLNDFLQSLSGDVDPDFWSREAVVNDQRWQRVRDLAAEVLHVLPDM
jgi:hypothetical protein